MTAVLAGGEVVRCEFDRCSSSIVYRVVLAVVDQLGAEADADLARLEALDVPLEDSVVALSVREIESAAVTLRADRLVIDLHLRFGDGLMDTAPLGEVTEIVESFFDVETTDVPPRVRLSARLG